MELETCWTPDESTQETVTITVFLLLPEEANESHRLNVVLLREIASAPGGGIGVQLESATVDQFAGSALPVLSV